MICKRHFNYSPQKELTCDLRPVRPCKQRSSSHLYGHYSWIANEPVLCTTQFCPQYPNLILAWKEDYGPPWTLNYPIRSQNILFIWVYLLPLMWISISNSWRVKHSLGVLLNSVWPWSKSNWRWKKRWQEENMGKNTKPRKDKGHNCDFLFISPFPDSEIHCSSPRK